MIMRKILRYICHRDISIKSFPFFSLFSLLIIFSVFHLSLATDAITLTQSLPDGETLVSSSHNFELGFFSLGRSQNRYLGIWYNNSPDAIVWVANRNNPITDLSGALTIRNDGNLFIIKQSNRIVWSSNISGVAENPVAQLLDSGNLVIRNNVSNTSSESYLWQSFDYPSDTLLPGMKLGWNLRFGLQKSLNSWRSSDDPSSGNFTYKLDIDELLQLVIRRGSKKTYRTEPWSGNNFGSTAIVSNLAFKPAMVIRDDEIYYTYEPVSNTITMRFVLNQTGLFQRLVWNDDISAWSIIFSTPPELCDNYGYCGPNGLCNASQSPVCQCLNGFVPKSKKDWELHNWTDGCVRSTPLDCLKDNDFVRVQGVKVPDLSEYYVNKSMSLGECEVECSKNCSCVAYANSNASNGGSGCLMWCGDLVDMRLVAEEFRREDIYIRQPASSIESSHDSNNKRRHKIVVGVSIFAVVVFLSLVSCFIIWKDRADRRGPGSHKDIELPLFDLATIAAATNNFSQTNVIGEGGFGAVYKGTLQSGEEIAVKRLAKNSGQGLEQFMNEINLIAKLQHKNLVGLLGCCIEGEERILVYEYMPNESLDYFIFDYQRSALLKWEARFNIVLGIARGLLYLHQDSKLQIIHRDLKVSNILLDNNLNPKISDFGLARIFEGDDRKETTKRVVGTYGYMSPEYALDGIISFKCDVFSLGVLILEVVTGKKNRVFFLAEHDHNLLGHAWLLWSEGRAMELVGRCLKDSCVVWQVLRCVHVGLLCVQNYPEDRPTMSSVIFMLANQSAVPPQPKQPGFFRNRTENRNARSPSSEQSYTENTLSMTLMDGR